MEILRITGLTKRFGKIIAVDNIDLEVMEGECVGLLGPNGAGKTTTIKVITGLLKPNKGKVFIKDIDVIKHPKKALKHVGAMIESPELYPELTPRQILTYIGKLRGIPRSQLTNLIEDAVKKVRMTEWIDTPTGKFSRGMKQRIALAQAFFTHPDIIILDEPSLGLDPRGMVEIRQIIKDLNREGATILMASHLLNEVQQVCTSVALINRGKIVLREDISALDKAIRQLIYEVKLIDEVNESILEEIRGINGVTGAKMVDKNTVALTINGTSEVVEKVLRSLVSKLNLRVIEFKMSSNLLESLYMDLVKEVS